MTLVDTLIKLKDDKAKGVAFKNSEDTNRPARSILTLKPLPIIDPKDKGKGVLEEPESAKKMTKSDFDAAQLLEMKRLLDNWKAKLLAEYFERRKTQLAEERVATIRNKPPTKTKLRRLMMTYLKNMDFVPIGFEEDERRYRDMNKKAEKESSDKEKEKLKTFLKIDLDEEGIIDYEVLDKRFPIITWESKFYHYDRHGAERIYYRIFKSDGSSRWIKTFSEMVTRFDRLDLVELYNLVMQRFKTTSLKGVDLILWGDLRTMFKANTEDELWQNQEEWSLKSWIFYENCGVHILILKDGTEIHMLAERRLMNLEAMIEEKRIFKCWFYHHTTNGHQLTMSNRHQELTSLEANNF
nr:hypothetical protein [Tanacetum cinerariifolium]